MLQRISFVPALLMAGIGFAAVADQPAEVSRLIRKNLGFDGKEAELLRVDYAPGGSDPVHRHNADVIVYVLSGSVVMQVEGGEEVTLKPGDTFVEGRDDVHLVERNASDSAPASFLAFFVKDAGAEAVLPVK
ncbi:MAG: cupin domain-containing protein [Paracoccus sp. (in: a-proteobacteria)]